MVEEAYAVIRGWGFTPKAEIVWVKTKIATGIVQDEHDLSFGMGRYVRAAHETCVVATRGKPSLCRPQTMSVRSVFYAPRGAHSAKPEAFYRLVERMYEGPYLELYGRRLRDGWTVLGEEVAHLSEVGS